MHEPRAARRTDAVRNTERIVEAAALQLRQRPDATMTSIARVAGVGRATLYGHFESRRDLVDAALAREFSEAQRALDTMTGDPDSARALENVLNRSWQLMDQSRSLVIAACEELSPERLWELHEVPAARITALIQRGQDAGTFRTDLPMWWLIAAIHRIFHATPGDFGVRRTDPSQMPAVMTETVLALLHRPTSSPQEVPQ
ncbi:MULTISPECIES: TetR/AcrR family transcriptional regulator [Brevibacterium]|uniref:TetR/AcrR family transcriptional regulator n=1 Tax=Brevibacterium TaxID=1696 RepID=UPI0010F98BA8|nr:MULTISPECIES: TetR/AcrR family transcriptional regulator [unclassified Brevibacterium]MCM1013510.1 TetR/AcrR family transcriptional regulator [Brevibacterium sp. XM4083]